MRKKENTIQIFVAIKFANPIAQPNTTSLTKTTNKIFALTASNNTKNNHFASTASKFILKAQTMGRSGSCAMNASTGSILNVLIFMRITIAPFSYASNARR